jgi:predicted enzyme related to lactoylglutathione lyase
MQPDPGGHAPTDSSPLGGLDHVYYWVTDMDRAARFYGEVLGLALVRRDGDEWAEFDAGSTRLALHARGSGQPHVTGGATAVFQVEDLDAAKVALSSRGVEFGHEGEVKGFARFASFADPDGNTLQIIEYAAGAGR